MEPNVKYLKSVPGILKIATIVIGFLVAIIGIAGKDYPSNDYRNPSYNFTLRRPYHPTARSQIISGTNMTNETNETHETYETYETNRNPVKVKATVFGLFGVPADPDVTCRVKSPYRHGDFIPKTYNGAQDFLLAMAIIWFLVSIANIVFYVLMIKKVSEKMLKMVKLGDMIGHLVGGFLLFVAGCVMLAHTSTQFDCTCGSWCHDAKEERKIDPKSPSLERWDTACTECTKYMSLYAKIAAGILCLLNGFLFFGVAAALFIFPTPGAGGGAGGAEGAGPQQQVGNQNPANGGTQPTPKASNQVANKPSNVQPQPVPDNS